MFEAGFQGTVIYSLLDWIGMLPEDYLVHPKYQVKLTGRLFADDIGSGECTNSSSWTEESGTLPGNISKLHIQVSIF
jgi:hypothetical protein